MAMLALSLALGVAGASTSAHEAVVIAGLSAFGLTPYIFLAGLARSSLARGGAVSDLLGRLAEQPRRGELRDALARALEGLREGDLGALREMAARGRGLEGGPAGRLSYLTAFLEGLAGVRRERYLEAARVAAGRVHFTGRLEHDDLPSVLPSFEALVVPSTFPEAFGMVAAEGAACGALPLSAGHSGLAEVTAVLAEGLEDPLRPLLSFQRGPGAVEEIARKLLEWLQLDAARRERTSASLADTARRRFGWEAVARGVIAAALGRLEELPRPGGAGESPGRESG